MATDDEPQPPESGAVKQTSILRCKLCERASECPSTDQIRSAQSEWPLCYGQAMELFIQSGQSIAISPRDDEATDGPPSPDVDGGRDADRYKFNPDGLRS